MAKVMWRQAAAVALVSGVIACGGGNGSPSGPSGGGGGGATVPSGSSPGATGATITIGANGAVSPSSVSISVGQSVTFVNNDSRARQMSSDPHPAHTACPSINALGNLATGQTRLTNSFAGAGTCGFHDHNDPDNNAVKGTITIR